MINNKKVLIVDDEPNAIRVLSVILKEDGYHVFEALNVDTAVNILHSNDIDAVITDLKMPGKDGFQLFNHVTEHYPHAPIIFLTAYGTVESAVNAMSCGACYYFIKPPDYSKLKKVLASAIEQHAERKRLDTLKRTTFQDINLPRIIGVSPSMAKIMKTIETVADSESSVLIQGETGTGKEVIASNLHYLGKRCSKPFVAVNCAAIPRELIESELFGYEKGAFTGAATARRGKFEEAADGTLFLDELGELELSVQAKLLRALQEREIERLGANKKIKVDFRLISSTNKDLKKEVEQGRFREDLFYRITVVQVDVPPLRERRMDIPLLARKFLEFFSVREDRLFTFDDEVMEIFMKYQWPGNVRQLRNVIERAVVLAKGTQISAYELPEEMLDHRRDTVPVSAIKPLKALELQAIMEALSLYNGNKSEAARNLGISRKTFYKRMREI